MTKFHILIFFIVTSWNLFSQENKLLIGEWKVVSVSTANFYYDVEKDSIELSEKLKKTYRNKISRQDYDATIRLENRNSSFIFDENFNYDFYLSKSERTKYSTFTGTYQLNGNIITLNVTNLSKNKLIQKASFIFKDDKLFLNMYLDTNYETKYVLQLNE